MAEAARASTRCWYEGDVYGNYAMPGRKYAFLAGVEGLLLAAALEPGHGNDGNHDVPSGPRTISDANLINFNPGYQGAFRTYLGIRNCACGDEIRFTFLNFNSAESLRARPRPT